MIDSSFFRYGVLFILSCGLLITAFLIQMIYQLPPCLICVTQRIVIALLALVSFAYLFNRNKSKIKIRLGGMIVVLLSVLGFALAARHTYLEYHANSFHAACLPGFDYLFQVLPFSELLEKMLLGGPSCSVVKWKLLTFSMAEWLLLIFLITGFIGFLELYKSRQPKSL